METTEIKLNENTETTDTELASAEIKPYTIRNPKAADIATFLKLFSKLGINNFKEYIDPFTGEPVKQGK